MELSEVEGDADELNHINDATDLIALYTQQEYTRFQKLLACFADDQFLGGPQSFKFYIELQELLQQEAVETVLSRILFAIKKYEKKMLKCRLVFDLFVGENYISGVAPLT